MTYHLLYNEGGRTKLRSFSTIQERTEWVGAFTLSHLDNRTDNQVWILFTGAIDKINDEEFSCGNPPQEPTMVGQCRCAKCPPPGPRCLDPGNPERIPNCDCPLCRPRRPGPR